MEVGALVAPRACNCDPGVLQSEDTGAAFSTLSPDSLVPGKPALWPLLGCDPLVAGPKATELPDKVERTILFGQ